MTLEEFNYNYKRLRSRERVLYVKSAMKQLFDYHSYGQHYYMRFLNYNHIKRPKEMVFTNHFNQRLKERYRELTGEERQEFVTRFMDAVRYGETTAEMTDGRYVTYVKQPNQRFFDGEVGFKYTKLAIVGHHEEGKIVFITVTIQVDKTQAKRVITNFLTPDTVENDICHGGDVKPDPGYLVREMGGSQVQDVKTKEKENE